MDARPPEPKVAFYLFMMRKELLPFLHSTEDILMIHVFDALGEAHGRSAEGFKWALECPGAIDTTKVLTLSGLSKLQGEEVHACQQLRQTDMLIDNVGKAKGIANVWWGPVALSNIDESTLIRAFEWYDRAAASPGTVGSRTSLFFEFFTTVGHLCFRFVYSD